MNPAGRNYSACEREALAVIFALKRFCVYLLSTLAFKLITDHQALKDAFKKKEIHIRLTRWLDFLAEYDYLAEYEFEICYRPGDKNKAADFLSRYAQDPPSDEEWEDILAVEEEEESQFQNLEPRLQYICRYVMGIQMKEQDLKKRKSIR